MREILFRGKTRSGEWVYGGYFKTDNESYIIKNTDGIADFALWDFAEYVIPETVGQYTGLTDKKGKKIFEGDIVKAIISINDYSRDRVRKEEGIYEIKYHTEHCYFYLAKEGNNLLFDGNWRYYLYEIKVIGNIHDNPELLEGKWKNIII